MKHSIHHTWFWKTVDEHWLSRELALQGIWDVHEGKQTNTLQDWLALFGEPVGVFFHTIYVWKDDEVEKPTYYVESSFTPYLEHCKESYTTVEEAVEDALMSEALYAADAQLATVIDTPFRFPPYYDRKPDAEKLQAMGVKQLPDGNGGDDDYIVVDVNERTWIYGENGDDVLYADKMRHYRKVLGPLPLSSLSQLG